MRLRGTDIAGIGARISERANPGEVRVSLTVKDLVAESGLRVEERGDYRLKDIDDMWTLYSAMT